MSRCGSCQKYLSSLVLLLFTLHIVISQSILADTVLCFSALDNLKRERQTWLKVSRNGEDGSNCASSLLHMIES